MYFCTVGCECLKNPITSGLGDFCWSANTSSCWHTESCLLFILKKRTKILVVYLILVFIFLKNICVQSVTVTNLKCSFAGMYVWTVRSSWQYCSLLVLIFLISFWICRGFFYTYVFVVKVKYNQSIYLPIHPSVRPYLWKRKMHHHHHSQSFNSHP